MFLADTTQDPLIPTGSELILGIVCFVIVFGILGKMLLPRITKMLNEREDAIQGGINRADEAQAEAQAVLNQYRAQLEDAKHEAARMREEAREAGAQIIAEMRTQAEADARRITEAAQAQIQAERQQAAVDELHDRRGADRLRRAEPKHQRVARDGHSGTTFANG